MPDPLRLIKRAVSMPPGVLAAKLRAKLSARSRDRRERSHDSDTTTFRPDAQSPSRPLTRLIASVDHTLLAPHRDVLAALAGRALAHEFDLLGSGWTHVHNTHGLDVTDANRPEAKRIAALLPPGYTPIDWHTDFKSGHRWDPRVWYRDQPQVVGRGIDVKVPWELSRMQHLPLLAWGYALAAAGDGMPESAERYRDEYRAQVLDFTAHNPPRFGINWNCAMDVGIRVAGWVLTHDLFRAAGAEFDDVFMSIFTRSIREHADHLAANLEWDEHIRGNHYLADVAGLLIASAYLPADKTTDAQMHFASRELVAETLRQFHEDGSNFEASTSYHRLSAEMVVYALAVLQGVTRTRIDALTGENWHAYRPGEPSPALALDKTGSDADSVIPPQAIDRVARMARFTEDLLDRHGRDPQIGDNDSGRFFKLLPATMRDADGVLREDTRNHRHLIDAVDGFFPTSRALEGAGLPPKVIDPLPHGRGSLMAETKLIHGLLGGASFPRPDLPPFTDHAAYPGMGLYVYKHGRLTTIVRCGEVGQHGHGGHAHDDQLSFVLYVDGEPVIIDPGTGCYTADPALRNTLRHVARHNAVVQTGTVRRMSELKQDGLFRMRDRAQATLLAQSNTGLVGEHVLYDKPTRREIRCWDNELEVVDQPQGLADRYAALHLAPGVSVARVSDDCMRLRAGSTLLRITLTHSATIAIDPADCSESYGAPLVEATRLSFPLRGSADCVCKVAVLGDAP